MPPEKRKRVHLKPRTTMVRSPANPPRRHDFLPDTVPESPPPVPHKTNPKPSVKDYPPPAHLFKTPTVGASPSSLPQRRASAHSDPLSRPSPSAQPQRSASSTVAPQIRAPASVAPQIRAPASVAHQIRAPASSGNRQASTPQHHQVQPTDLPTSRASQSPRSSEAQNSPTGFQEGDSEAEDGEFSDIDAPIEPNLAQDQLESLNAILLGPRPNKITILDPDLIEPNSTWFGFDDSKLTRQVTKCFTRKFDGPYYSISSVPRERIERWFVEFAKKHRWDPSITGLVQEEFEAILQNRLKDMVSNARSLDEQPKWIIDKIWETMKAHWATDQQIAKRAKTSEARMSQRKGLGPHKHTCGPKSYRQLGREMAVELGRPVSYGEIFIRANTKKDGSFVDKKAEEVADSYLKKKGEKLSNLGSELSDGRAPELSVQEDNELFLQSTCVNERGHVFGMGSLQEDLVGKGKGKNPQISASVLKMQQELEEAKRLLSEQAALIARQEEENARLAAAQQAQTVHLNIMDKFLKTDDRFLAFLATETATGTGGSSSTQLV